MRVQTIFLSFFLLFTAISHAQDYDTKINEIAKQIQDLEKAIAPLQKETFNLKQKIQSAQNQTISLEKDLQQLSSNLEQSKKNLSEEQKRFDVRVSSYYKSSKSYSPLLILANSSKGNYSLRLYNLYQNILKRDQDSITGFVTKINSLNQNLEKLSADKQKLILVKKSLESRFGFLAGEIKKAEVYKQQLSQKQKELIAQKESLLATSVGDVSTSDDPASRSDYNPGFSPAFAVFSFGAPHRKGMSQYGAYARAKSGQSFETILKSYYGDIKLEKVETGGSIKTTAGTIPFEDRYLMGIAEMPIRWGEDGGMEALKAQAIAARTYALSYTNNLSGSICVTESCQVYKSSHADSPGVWKRAVEETRGLIVKSNQTNQIFSTLYASTSGGYINSYTSNGHSTSGFWDTTCGNGGCWPSLAYEKQIPSPWYYKAWYKTRSNQAAGRSHPWLNSQEMADIANALLYFSKTQDSSHLSQTQNCLSSCDSNAWSPDELKRQVGDKGGPISQIIKASVDFGSDGSTRTIHLSTDRGNLDFSGTDFKTIFSLRAPGAIHVKSTLFNIEQK